jgi:hypothetical protein
MSNIFTKYVGTVAKSPDWTCPEMDIAPFDTLARLVRRVARLPLKGLMPVKPPAPRM